MIKIIKIMSVLLLVAVIVIVVFISTLDINQYKAEIIEFAEENTGRELQVGGDLQFAASLIPTLVLEDVKFSNATWGSTAEMLSLDKFEVQVALLPLLRGDIQINKVILLAPKIFLETNKKGVGNWVFASQNQEEASSKDVGANPKIIVNEIYLKNAEISYKDGITGQKTNLIIEEIKTASKGADQPLSVFMKAAYNTVSIEAKGSLGSLNQLTSNKNYPIDLTVALNDFNIALKGAVAKPTEGKGVNLGITFKLDSLAELSELVGNDLPTLGPVSFTGKLVDTKGVYSIKEMKLVLANTDLSGNVTANLSGKRPAITANLSSNMIDLMELMAAGSPESATENSSKDKVFSSDPLPLEGLKSVNAKITINAKKIKTSSVILDNTTVSVSLKEGNLIMNPVTTLLAGGSLKGNIGLNTSGKTARLTSDININSLDLTQLGDLNDKMSGAITDISFKATGSGNSISQIMADLNGKLVLQMGKSEFKGLGIGAVTTDLLTMLNPLAKGSDSTQLECAVVNFTIKEGIASTDKGIVFSTSKMNIIGSGLVDLKTEKLNIAFSPNAREGVGINASKLAGLVKLGGTLANPTPTADLKGTITTGLSVGAALATGGLSLLAEGLLDRTTADANPCATALSNKPVSRIEAEQTPQESAIESKPVEAVKEAGSSAVDKVKGLFR